MRYSTVGSIAFSCSWYCSACSVLTIGGLVLGCDRRAVMRRGWRIGECQGKDVP